MRAIAACAVSVLPLEWTAEAITYAIASTTPDLVLAIDIVYPFKNNGPFLSVLQVLLNGVVLRVLVSYRATHTSRVQPTYYQ